MAVSRALSVVNDPAQANRTQFVTVLGSCNQTVSRTSDRLFMQVRRLEADIRLLQVARLSRLNDDSSSLDKQDQQCQRWADAYGHEIIGTAADSNISGKTYPFARPAPRPCPPSPPLTASHP